MNSEFASKNVFIRNWGCQMNVRDSEVVAGLLMNVGYRLVDDAAKADIVIFNTCSVRQHAEDKVWSEIGRIAKAARREHKNIPQKAGYRRIPIAPGARAQEHRQVIGLIGCMAQNYKEQAFERCAAIDFVAGPSDIEKIPAILEKVITSQGRHVTGGLYEMKIWETDGQGRSEEIYHTGFRQDPAHAYIVISEGCSNFCTYCVVPYVRGPLRSRSHSDILREIEEAAAQGIRKVTLLGQNVNSYKSPYEGAQERKSTRAQVNFVDLLRLVNGVKGLEEFSFITSHPRDTTIEVFKAMAECDKLKKYLHLPVQSGSDRILERMNRGYTRKFYLDLARDYRTIVTGGALTTDIIVGFPGETEQDFRDTMELVKEVGFDAAFIFKYSVRPHASAGALADDVPLAEKELRHAGILQLQKSISLKKKSQKNA